MSPWWRLRMARQNWCLLWLKNQQIWINITFTLHPTSSRTLSYQLLLSRKWSLITSLSLRSKLSCQTCYKEAQLVFKTALISIWKKPRSVKEMSTMTSKTFWTALRKILLGPLFWAAVSVPSWLTNLPTASLTCQENSKVSWLVVKMASVMQF